VIPVKGASVYGKPVANMPRKRNKNGVYLTEIGTDTAKEQIYNRLTLTPDTDGPSLAQSTSRTIPTSSICPKRSKSQQKSRLKNG
jgi:phage terminase large subunit GpA-like protein